MDATRSSLERMRALIEEGKTFAVDQRISGRWENQYIVDRFLNILLELQNELTSAKTV